MAYHLGCNNYIAFGYQKSRQEDSRYYIIIDTSTYEKRCDFNIHKSEKFWNYWQEY